MRLPEEVADNMAVVITEENPAGPLHLSKLWHRTAPRRVVKKYRADDLPGGWTAWQFYIRQRKKPAAPPFLKGRRPPLLWSWHSAWSPDEIQSAIDRPLRFADEQLGRSEPLAADLPGAMKALVLSYSLPSLAGKVSADSWWALVAQLQNLVTESQHERVDSQSDLNEVLMQQLLTGELPLALSYLFPELKELRGIRKGARASLTELLLTMTDGEGLPHANLLPMLGPLFASWTRCRWLGEESGRGAWTRAADSQYRLLVRHAIRLANPNGRFALTPGDADDPAWTKSLFAMALGLMGDERACAAASVALADRVVPRRIKFNPDRAPKASFDSEWSGISVLSTDWSRSAIRVAIAYADEPVRFELAVGGERLFAGLWQIETHCDGEPVRVVGEWENLCWQSNKRCDLLELGVELSHGLRLERQLVLGHKDRVLYLADMVFSADGTPRRLQHSFGLPLDYNSRWQPEPETRDGLVCSAGLQAAVFPLALSEWRADPRGGTLVENNGRLLLTHEFTGRVLCCPLFLDLDPVRAKKQRTWRQLTIGESMEVVPRDVAVGYRVQSGHDQWLVYRSLGAASNRTVLGQNIAGEFCAGPFRSTGKLDEWIEIETV